MAFAKEELSDRAPILPTKRRTLAHFKAVSTSPTMRRVFSMLSPRFDKGDANLQFRWLRQQFLPRGGVRVGAVIGQDLIEQTEVLLLTQPAAESCKSTTIAIKMGQPGRG
jgi:hypothetical protein